MDRCFAITDRRYPSRLRALKDAPPSIYVRGALPHLSPSVAIVGTRRATEEARIFVEELACELAIAGVTVISGGALGIDGAAHRGAVQARKPTIVVLPTSLKSPSPRSNRPLFREILEHGGAWVSEHDRVAWRSDFRARNRLIAALADLVIVAQAAHHSGTRHTIVAAKTLGKTVAAIPWSPADPRSETCLEIIKKGGPAITSSRDVLAVLNLKIPRKRAPISIEDGATAVEARVLSLLRDEGSHTADAIAARIDAGASAVLSAITELELAGKIAADRSGKLGLRKTGVGGRLHGISNR